MGKGATKLSFIVTALILGVMLCVIAFVVPFHHTYTFWTGLIFAFLSIILCIFISGYAFDDSSARSRFYNLPLAEVVWGYFILQIVFGFICMIFSSIPEWIAILVSVFLIVGCLLGITAADASKEYERNVDDRQNSKVFYIRSLQSDIEEMQRRTEDVDLSGQLNKLAEDIRYSDPDSTDRIAGIETHIADDVNELGKLIDAGNTEQAVNMCSEISSLLSQRADKCKLMKQQM